MTREDREHAAGWGVSAIVHVFLLMAVAATGLFAAVSSESRPLDVEVYEDMMQESQAVETAAAAVPEPLPEMDPIVLDKKSEERREERREEKKDERRDHHGAHSDAPSSGERKGSNGPPPRDPDAVKRVKVHAVELGGTLPRYPAGATGHGSVTVVYVVSASGTVVSPEITASPGDPALDAAVLDAIRSYSYIPAQNEYGEAVASRGRKTFNF